MPQETAATNKWMPNAPSKAKMYSNWLRQGKKKSTFLCTVCNTELSFANGGWANLKSHAEHSQHLQFLRDSIEIGQSPVSNPTKSSSTNTSTSEGIRRSTTALPPIGHKPSSWTLYQSTDRQLTHAEKVIRAECYWTMASSQLGFSSALSQSMPDLFASMFPDSRIATDFAKADHHCSHVMIKGTTQFFLQEFIKDVLNAPVYSLIFDENIVTGGSKQLDVHVRYWSEYKESVVTRYWRTIVYTNSSPEAVGRYLLDLLKVDGLDLCKLLQLGELITTRDNLNANRAIEAMVDKRIRAERETK